jgi:hypothetical protein
MMGGNFRYGTREELFDIAIIEVDTPFTLNKFVVPAKLPTDRTPVGTNLTVSGWGALFESKLLRYTKHPPRIGIHSTLATKLGD